MLIFRPVEKQREFLSGQAVRTIDVRRERLARRTSAVAPGHRGGLLRQERGNAEAHDDEEQEGHLDERESVVEEHRRGEASDAGDDADEEPAPRRIVGPSLGQQASESVARRARRA